MQDADVVQLGKTHFVLALKVEDQNNDSTDFDENTLVLYTKTEDECASWVTALRHAANRKLESHYEIGPVIGEGGFARVRLGRCMLTGELRAIKTMNKNEEHARLFGREVAIIKRVNHPNIVKTYDVYETNKQIHIVMEYMKGGMLYDAIEDGIRFKEQDTAQFMREIIDGIMYLHQQGIVHRDIKPENVLCTSKAPPFHVKISDFGLSSISSTAEMRSNQMLMSTIIGTPEFIAPEIANRQEYTEKVDMWALGMLCYNVICGQLPFDENRDMLSQLRKGISLIFPEKEWEEYSMECRSFVKSLLCTNPEKRLTPLACLVHPWLEQQHPMMSNKIGAHSRISQFILEQESFVLSLRPLSGKPLLESSAHGAVKRRWLVAYVAVSATNRLEWLINPNKYIKAKSALPNSGYRKHSSITDDSVSELPGEVSQISTLFDVEPALEQSDTEEEGGSSKASTSWNTLKAAAEASVLALKRNSGARALTAKRGSEASMPSSKMSSTASAHSMSTGAKAVPVKTDSGASTQGGKMSPVTSAQASVANGQAVKKLTKSNDREEGGMRNENVMQFAPRQQRGRYIGGEDDVKGCKMGEDSDLEVAKHKGSLRQKLRCALGTDGGRGLSPVRKLSRRLKEELKKRGSQMSGQGSVDLETRGERLGLLELEDCEIGVSEDEGPGSFGSGPASLFGKKHRFLLSKRAEEEGMMSPMTPLKERGNLSPLAMHSVCINRGQESK